jgi:purine-binding chemotaxis protein CheW
MRVCLFLLGGERLAVDVAHSRGVVVFEDATRVPGAPPHILGIANLRGRLVALLDIRPALGLPAPVRGRAGTALVIEHGGIDAAVAIDEVIGIETFDDVHPLSERERARHGGFASARLARDDGPVMLLDAPRLIDALRSGAAPPGHRPPASAPTRGAMVTGPTAVVERT